MKNMNYRLFVLLLSLFALTFAACKKEANSGDDTFVIEQSVSLDKTGVFLQPGEETSLQALFGEGIVPQRNYTWLSSDVEIVAVEVQANHIVLLTAKAEGIATITYQSEDGKLTASCTVEVAVPDGVIRILAIGNSFSEDAIEHYLHGLADAAGVSVVIGNLYIGGASLARHVQEVDKEDGAATYSYRKIDVEGAKTTTANTSLASALTDERWDYVSLQQASANSGQYDTYAAHLPVLYKYVRNQLNRPSVKYVFHQTWAYAQNSTHAGFANYGNNQLTMYNAIVDAVNKAMRIGEVDMDVVIPAGTAIQNGRTSAVGDNFCRDGYHLNLNIGRYTAACTWYEAIFGQSVLGNTFAPVALPEFEVEIAQHAAHFAMQKPNEVTVMTDYQNWPEGPGLEDHVFLNFGTVVNTSTEWNNITIFEPHRYADLKDKSGRSTYMSLEITERFNRSIVNGATTTNTDWNMPSAVSRSSFYGNPIRPHPNPPDPTGIIVEKSALKFSGLKQGKQYNFCFFASAALGTYVETDYTVKGQSEITVSLEPRNNTSNTICANNIIPDSNGEVTIEITSGENNTNAHGFYFLNAMRISAAD